MGTTLTGTTPQDTYDSLIKVTDNGPLSGSLKTLTDGLGNDSALALSTSAASVTGTLAVSSGLTAVTGSFLGSSANGTLRAEIAVEGVASNNVALIAKTSNGGNDLFRWFDGATQLGVFKNSGNVGIGTSAPEQLLELSSSTTTGGQLLMESTTSGNGDYAGMRFKIAGGTNGGFEKAGIFAQRGSGGYQDLSLAFAINAVADATNVSISDTLVRITSAGVLDLAQGQIKFPATQVPSADANTLDDYEEGEWTIGVSFGGASVGVTTSLNTGSYVKVGRKVTVTGFLALTSKGSSTGAAAITGLPFAVANLSQNYSSASIWFENVSFLNQLTSFGDVNTTNLLLFEASSLGVVTTITDADFADNSGIMLSFTYFV